MIILLDAAHVQYVSNMISTNLDVTEMQYKNVRLKQNADAYQCEMVFISFRKRQHNSTYCVSYTLTV